jgi:hypothetical protein
MDEDCETLVLDASVLINFLGSGCVETLLGALPARILMADRTFDEVVKDPSGRMPAPEDRRALIARGLIAVQGLDRVASELFLELVCKPDCLDDGEAAAVALAAVAGAVPVLDEKRARRVFRERYPGQPLASSAGLFRSLYENGRLPPEQVREALRQALQKARMSVVPEELEWTVRILGPELARACPSLRKAALRW